MTPDIVLVGYYGRGNFGDDVLMMVAHKIARQLMPHAEIGIRLPPDAIYPERLIGEHFVRVAFGTRDVHRLIIHGGGGNFFDFEKHGVINRALNAALLAGGTSTFVRAEQAVRRFTGQKRMAAGARIGLGLGIGTFAVGSPRLRDALPLLADFDVLWARDDGSEVNLQRLGVTAPVILGSDLAFLWEHWCPPDLILSAPKPRAKRPRVGVILRDWPPGGRGSEFAVQMAEKLDILSTRFDITVISLDPATDQKTLECLRSFAQVLWRADSIDIRRFCEVLAAHDVMVTARAHGAICGACVGRPSVILNIEPKLAAVHAMLPNATRMAFPGAGPEVLASLIDEVLAIPPMVIAADATGNRMKSLNAFAAIRGEVKL